MPHRRFRQNSCCKHEQGTLGPDDLGTKTCKIKPGFVILDVGCGGGKTISRLARRAGQGKVYGLDQSADMVDYSRQINRKLIAQNRVEIVQGSVEKTGFKDEFFDLVTAVETYYFWPNLAEAFREIKRVLKKGGYLLMINEMIKDGTYEVENAEIIAKTQVHLVAAAGNSEYFVFCRFQ